MEIKNKTGSQNIEQTLNLYQTSQNIEQNIEQRLNKHRKGLCFTTNKR